MDRMLNRYQQAGIIVCLPILETFHVALGSIDAKFCNR